MAIEIRIIALCYLGLIAAPDGLHRVQYLVRENKRWLGSLFQVSALIPLRLLTFELANDWISDEIGITPDNSREDPLVGEVFNSLLRIDRI